MAVGLLYLLGSLVDLGTLWGLQRQPGPNWEFVAIGSTLDALPRFGLAFGLLMLGSWAGGSGGTILRICGAGLLLVGAAAGVLGVLLVTDYLAIVAGGVPEPAAVMARASTIKGAAIGGLGLILFVTAGIVSVRSPVR